MRSIDAVARELGALMAEKALGVPLDQAVKIVRGHEGLVNALKRLKYANGVTDIETCCQIASEALAAWTEAVCDEGDTKGPPGGRRVGSGDEGQHNRKVYAKG